jgi:single-strand DNA-binding protein
MNAVNEVTILGRLTSTPNLRKTPSGISVIDMNVAINLPRSDEPTGNLCETCYVNVTAWRDLADICAEKCKKSFQVWVKGRLYHDIWMKGEQKRQRLKVVAEEMKIYDNTSELLSLL